MKKITKVVCSTALIVGMLGTAQAFSVSAMIRPIDKTYNYRRC